ncbi:MAG: hypothetical protein IPM92_09745 [Saprospiraceae bacterium]|nr:hypothetical protein [Saprospiraceae bacterium]
MHQSQSQIINLAWTGMIHASSVLENTISLTGSSGIGIALHEVLGQLTTVNDNTINIGPGLVGISRINCRYDAIAYNSIFSNQATSLENIGIKLEGGSDSWVLCNQLISAQQCANKGISVYQTPNNMTAGNFANGWFFDLHYVGPSTGTF